MQLFLKPSVEITDRDWDIKIELEDLKEEYKTSFKPYEFTSCWYVNTTQYCKTVKGFGEYKELDFEIISLINKNTIEEWYNNGKGISLNFTDEQIDELYNEEPAKYPYSLED
jgi:hypothetical protein